MTIAQIQDLLDNDKRLRARVAELEAAFNDQSRELEIACSIMTPDQLTEYRCRAYPNLYPLAT